MSVSVERKWVVYDTTTLQPIVPCLVLPERAVRKYVKEHPFPETKDYTTDDLIMDTQTDGMWTLPEYLTDEQRDYIREMVQAIIDGYDD